jgi:hypothetical protein
LKWGFPLEFEVKELFFLFFMTTIENLFFFVFCHEKGAQAVDQQSKFSICKHKYLHSSHFLLHGNVFLFFAVMFYRNGKAFFYKTNLIVCLLNYEDLTFNFFVEFINRKIENISRDFVCYRILAVFSMFRILIISRVISMRILTFCKYNLKNL